MRLSSINIIKILLSVALLICVFNLPYGYYQFVRFIALVGFSILAYDSNTKGRTVESVTFIFLAILFQPLIKISLGRELWRAVDIIVGTGLLLSLIHI